jgi:hypothetical protein
MLWRVPCEFRTRRAYSNFALRKLLAMHNGTWLNPVSQN